MNSKKHRKEYEHQGFWPPQAFPKPSQSPSKIDVPKNMQFWIEFCLFFVGCCRSQHKKNVRPHSVLLAFHTIQCFACCMHFWFKKPIKNPSKTRPEPLKNRCYKCGVFQHRFLQVSASILEPLEPPTCSQVRRAACSTRRVKPYRILCLH